MAIPSMAEGPRPIASVVDVRAILESGKFSFDEALSCIRVARHESEWALVERSAMAALDAVGHRPLRPQSVLEAAEAVAVAYLKHVDSLDGVDQAVDGVVEILSRVRLSNEQAARLVDEYVYWLGEVTLLLAEGSAISLVSLCARLRKLDRPDLGRASATAALRLEPDSEKALTTRGAAATDELEFELAEEDLSRAWSLTPSAFVANAKARLMLMSGRTSEAVEWAREAVRMDPESKASYSSLAAAAIASQNQGLLEEALTALAELEEGQGTLFADGLAHEWPLYLAAKTLAESGHLYKAIEEADRLESRSPALADRLREQIDKKRREG